MPYLTNAEYRERFGTDETTRLIDRDGTGTIIAAEEAVLTTAIQEASDFADAYIGSRYSLPLATTPPVVKMIVADLARERLYTLHPMEEVTDRGDRARKQLVDIAKGVIALIAADVRVEATTSDEIGTYAPDQIFTDDLLGGYKGWMGSA